MVEPNTVAPLRFTFTVTAEVEWPALAGAYVDRDIVLEKKVAERLIDWINDSDPIDVVVGNRAFHLSDWRAEETS